MFKKSCKKGSFITVFTATSRKQLGFTQRVDLWFFVCSFSILFRNFYSLCFMGDGKKVVVLGDKDNQIEDPSFQLGLNTLSFIEF